MDLSCVILRPMTVDDIVGGMRLSTSEGWNQTEDDWRFLIETKENICIVAEYEKSIIGTTTIANYGNKVAWIGMVLVDKEFRNRGVSKLLLENILQHVYKFKSIKLDATVAGLQVYEKFGFKEEYRITRMVAASIKNFSFENDDEILKANETDFEEIVDLDTNVFGNNRKELIAMLMKKFPSRIFLIKRNGIIKGFALGRKGTKCHHIGPVIVESFADAKVLISLALKELNGRSTVVDILNDKIELINYLEGLGFEKQREFTRMYKKENVFAKNPEQYYLICGPEFG